MSPALTSFLSLFKIRPGEERKALGMAAYVFASVGAFIVGRISRDTLFLELPDAKALLPYMYVAIAIGVSGTVFLYSRLERRVPRERLTGLALGLFTLGVLGCRYLVDLGPHSYWLYYVWVDVVGALMILQCWNFAGDIFNAREAKRLFAFIGGGGVLANVLCGLGVKAIVPEIGAKNLIWVVAALIASAFVLQRWLRGLHDSGLASGGAEKASERPSKGGRRTTLRTAVSPAASPLGSRHLQIVAALVVMTFCVSTLVDYQFKIVSRDAFQSADTRAAFFGLFFSLTGLLSAVVQFSLTSRLLERFGVLLALSLLPLALLSGSVGMLMMPGLVAATWVKGSENVLRYTINDATMQLLYVPVPSALRGRAKAFIDGILKPSAIGLSGLFLLLMAKHLGVAELSWFTAAVLVVWIALLFRLKREYVKTLMLTLRKRRLDFADSSLKISDDSTIAVLMDTLENPDEGHVLHAVEMLDLVDKRPKQLKERILALLLDSRLNVRLAALKYIERHGDFADVELLAQHLGDPSEEVRAHAISAVASVGRDRAIKTLEGFLKDPAPRVRAAVLASLIKHGGLDGILRSAEELKAMLSHSSPLMREHAAWVLGEIRVRNFYQPLLELFRDRDAQVRGAAIAASGKMLSPELIPALVYQLEDPKVAPAAVAALTAFGPEVEPILVKVLGSELEALAVRRQVPDILARRATPEGLRALLGFIDVDESDLRLQVLKAVGKLHERFAEVAIPEERVMQVVHQELKRFYQLIVVRADLELCPADVLMDDALRVRQQRALARIFRLLGLIYPYKTLEVVYANLSSTLPAARANAVEILDNILENEHKRLVIPIAEELPVAERLRIAEHEFEIGRKSRGAWIQRLLAERDGWLVVAALEMIGRLGLKELDADVKRCEDNLDPLVRETATWTLTRLSTPRRATA